MNGLKGRDVLVTGACSGIGKATAVRLAHEGAQVIMVDRRPDALDSAVAELAGSGHWSRLCDLTNEEETIALAEDVRSRGIRLSGIVHCAGIHWIRPLQITDNARMLEMLQSHVTSAVALMRAAVTKGLPAPDGCSVVWMSSAAALKGGAGTTAYAAAKGALIAAARVLAVELAKRRIRVNVIAPGVVRTPQGEAFLASLSAEQAKVVEEAHLLGLGDPDDVAGVVAFFLSSDSRWITGVTIPVDGGLTAH
jgi:NAD(P)-dependent dehydrogenase (short-subunit alcohol dehydrogenase family)